MDETDMMHGHVWRGQRLQGWWLSEKFDGIRAYWDGARMWSRSGALIPLPAIIARDLPTFPLDGEIWAGYGQLPAARLAVTHHRWTAAHRYLVFDAPGMAGDWPDRLAPVRSWVHGAKRVEVVECIESRNHQHPFKLMKQIHARGGEGVIARRPGVPYQACRTEDIVKLKRPFYSIFATR